MIFVAVMLYLLTCMHIAIMSYVRVESGSNDPGQTIWVTWVTFLVGQVVLIRKLNYLDVTQIFSRSHVL